MNQSCDPARCAVRQFAALSVYYLLFALLIADGSWRGDDRRVYRVRVRGAASGDPETGVS